MALAKRSKSNYLPGPIRTTFAHARRTDEFTVTTISGTLLTMSRIDPLPAADIAAIRPNYAPMPQFNIPGQNMRPDTFNAVANFVGRWEYFYLYDDCPITIVRRVPAGVPC